jgi:cystathionine beta-lyase/cystathionine gamma-synthase
MNDRPERREAGLATRFVHTGFERDPATGAVTPPVYRAVTFHQDDPWHPDRYDYSRSGNPTRAALENAVAELEGGCRGFAFASGNAALTAVILLFSAGDHLLVTRDCQGGTQRLFRMVFSRLGIDVTYVDTHDPDQLTRALRPNTRAVLAENFSNPFLFVTDIAALAEWAHGHDLLVVVDNTFITPAGQNPLRLGADIVVHSATKMMAGHSDVTAGVAVARDPAWAERLYGIQNATGGILSPDDAYQVLRGLHTLPVRLDRASRGADRLAHWLLEQPGVTAVYYPGLPQHPGHAVARDTVRTFGPIVTCRLSDPDRAPDFVRALQLVEVGAGFGGTETVCSVAALHCHGALTPDERRVRDITPAVMRFSVGLEDPDDIIADIAAALERAGLS